jgi:hypothetical protein
VLVNITQKIQKSAKNPQKLLKNRKNATKIRKKKLEKPSLNPSTANNELFT